MDDMRDNFEEELEEDAVPALDKEDSLLADEDEDPLLAADDDEAGLLDQFGLHVEEEEEGPAF